MKKLNSILLLVLGMLMATSVNAQTVDGGTVQTEAGETTVYTCPGDAMADIVFFDSVTTNTVNYDYVITDDQNIILGLPPADFANFEGAGIGNCRVWGLSYTGNLTISMGVDVDTASTLSDGLFDLSSNYIDVIRDTAVVTTVATESGATTVYTCPGDGLPDVMRFDSVSTSSANFAYVITDDQNNILGLPPGDMADFDGAGIGNCRVWGLSYTGNLLVTTGDNAGSATLTDGCFELSSNFITVVRDTAVVTTVATESGATTVYTCPGDGLPDVMRFDSVSTSSANFAYVITDDQNNILGLPPGDMADFDGAGIGNCRVWGLSYTGNLLVTTGDNAGSATLTDGCFELSSNFITVVRDTAVVTTVATESGATTVYTCPGDGLPDVMRFDSTSTSSANFAYVITDDQNNILGLPSGDMADFDGAGIGNCRVWGLSYTGNLLVTTGDNAGSATLTDGCFELSSNYITVVRDTAVVTTVSLESGMDSVTTCPGDGDADVIRFDSISTSSANFRYVITDDQNTILGIPGGDFADVEGGGQGVCRVWGLSFTGNVLATPGDDAGAVTLTDGCFKLSSNYITVIRDSTGSACVTGIAEIEDLPIRLYPVPASDFIQLVFSATSSEAVQLDIYNTQGQLMTSRTSISGPGDVQERFNTNNYPSGIYVIHLQQGEQQARKTFIVE